MRFIDLPDNGPMTHFGDAHIYYALCVIEKEGTVSRSALADILGIGEGSVRKLVDVLKRWEVITVKKTGMMLSDYGLDFLKEFPMKIINVKWSEYVIGAYQRSVLVRGVVDKVTNGMYQRDCGIMAGANGASVFLMRDNKVIMPKSWDMDTRDPIFAGELRSAGMSEGDVVVISGASDPSVAAISAIAIGLDML